MLSIIKQLYRFVNPRFQNLFLEYKVNFKPRYGHGLPPHKQLYSIVNANRKQYYDFLTESLKYKERMWEIKKANKEQDNSKPTYNNGFLPGLDILGIYAMISKYCPETYMEVGSGNSTKVAFKAIHENGYKTRIVSIDPEPRAEIDKLADVVVRLPFENVKYDDFESLKENDILFIDNSHRILPNSDSTVFYLEVLPRLAKGVIVHIHDIYIPYDYPQFMCDRFYTEQYGLAINLLANCKRYQPILPNYFVSEDEELSAVVDPFWKHPNLEGVERHGGSFWLRIGE